MKSPILFIIIVLCTTLAFGQTKKTKTADQQSQLEKPYFPLSTPNNNNDPIEPEYIHYRNLTGTIGEQYLVLSLYAPSQTYNDFRKADQPEVDLSSKEMAGKKLTLMSVLRSGTVVLKDSTGLSYTIRVVDGAIPYVISYTDIENARRLYLHKTLWMKFHAFKVSARKHSRLIGIYEPVVIANITPGTSSTPVKLTIKTLQRETATINVNISDTNIPIISGKLDPESVGKHRFYEIFYTNDNPRLAYNLSPAMWKIVEKGDIYIGMPGKALKVILGPPDRINTTTTAYGNHEQWVYGNYSYYYVENGILTAVQN